jgi:dolichol-phosphate mannosyltransferase
VIGLVGLDGFDLSNLNASNPLSVTVSTIALTVLVIQTPAVLLLLSRMLRGPFRQPPLKPKISSLGACDRPASVSVVVPTLNEVLRLSPCLEGLAAQDETLREVLVVDSYSTDGTGDLVIAASKQDSRFRLMHDEKLPSDWVGRPWALHSGFLATDEASEWVLGVDADTQPQPGLVASLIETADRLGYDLISLSPQFILKKPGEIWLQPALLMTLVYRFGAAGELGNDPNRVMANGQCFLCRRSLLVALGGYSSARNSFCDDVTLARNAAAQGAKVGFLDGAKVLKVRMYDGIAETWTEWGRSLDLKDAAEFGQVWADFTFLLLVQALPIVLLPLTIGFWFSGVQTLTVLGLLVSNLALVIMRFALLLAIVPSYDFSSARGKWLFWLSPFADPAAVYRIFLSSSRQPKQWRGRSYGTMAEPQKAMP